MNDLHWMQQAYALACQAQTLGEVPVGAILVSSEGRVLGTGYNCTIQHQDPTAHAEILTIRAAAKTLQNYRLLHSTLYVTLEPCCMCAGALIQARINRLVFATRDLNAGAAGSHYNLLNGFPLNHRVKIDEGVMQEECSQLLQQFFRQCRQQPGRE